MPIPVRRTIQVRAFQGDRQYVAECLDFAVVTQAPTLDQLAQSIREAIGLHLEGEDLTELGISEDPTVVVTLELQPVAGWLA
jgi:predicted RNase H-like HicB family nuclease